MILRGNGKCPSFALGTDFRVRKSSTVFTIPNQNYAPLMQEGLGNQPVQIEKYRQVLYNANTGYQISHVVLMPDAAGFSYWLGDGILPEVAMLQRPQALPTQGNGDMYRVTPAMVMSRMYSPQIEVSK